ncbi:hypothetical protein JOC75_004047 [Metabacillus crassostreae]|uniref:hypothetical protein n=1 Tax=Metabacillus crassostreae TaxID=929098 RepID=UPI00195F16D3|nr:hypothetical protein [Metabacillus crassostreae]MBM7606019.1 hypothetical protein [Metabacillus crassostreae]
MKETIKLSIFQKDMVIVAMRNFRNTKDRMGQKLFDVAFEKVRKMNKQVELDGMEMIYITQSLRFQSKEFAQEGKKEVSHLYRNFGDQLEEVRKAFQMRNLPEILKNKKAASASTLTA